LLDEKKELETELNEVAKNEPGQGWEATSGEMDIDTADDNEVADKLEEYETNKGVMDKLQKQLSEVDAALERIENGTYGICENTHKPIDRDRLEANPSARISLK
jgi:RNA polymerase-binding transcription factor DksA